ncbi:MAG: hypothetical protein ACP5P2_00105 [Candidatus Micrarchaeia archaeon]|jgi:hypothetical protein
MGETFTINRIQLRKDLTLLGVSEININALEAELEKKHRHVNAVTFAELLQKAGLKQGEIINLFRRIGVSDVKSIEIMNALDEEKINEAYGRVVELDIGD